MLDRSAEQLANMGQVWFLFWMRRVLASSSGRVESCRYTRVHLLSHADTRPPTYTLILALTLSVLVFLSLSLIYVSVSLSLSPLRALSQVRLTPTLHHQHRKHWTPWT